MTLSDIQADTRYWQRLLRLAGFYSGKTDGLVGPLTRAAEERWILAARAAREEFGTFDDRSERVIATLLPEAQRLARRWLRAAKKKALELGVEVKLIDGTRSYAEQNKLYAKVPRVTKAKGGQSWHNFGLAFDFGLFTGGQYLGDSPHYSTLGALASTCEGGDWGGSWKSFKDLPHIQLRKFSGTAEARATFEK